MNLSRHFTLAELTHSDTAAREGIPNQPTANEVVALRALCGAVLDPLREAVGRPIKVNSGYRGPALNRRIGGATSSQHLFGQAADIQSPGTPVLELFKTVIRLGLPFDQLIYEAQNANTKWVHVSHRPGANRGEIRIATFGPNGRPTGYPRATVQQALEMSERATRSLRAATEPGHVERADEPEPEAPEASAAASAAVRRQPGSGVNAAATTKTAARRTPAKKAAGAGKSAPIPAPVAKAAGRKSTPKPAATKKTATATPKAALAGTGAAGRAGTRRRRG